MTMRINDRLFENKTLILCSWTVACENEAPSLFAYCTLQPPKTRFYYCVHKIKKRDEGEPLTNYEFINISLWKRGIIRSYSVCKLKTLRKRDTNSEFINYGNEALTKSFCIHHDPREWGIVTVCIKYKTVPKRDTNSVHKLQTRENEALSLFAYMCNRVYCIHVPGHDPITFSFRSFPFLFGFMAQ